MDAACKAKGGVYVIHASWCVGYEEEKSGEILCELYLNNNNEAGRCPDLKSMVLSTPGTLPPSILNLLVQTTLL